MSYALYFSHKNDIYLIYKWMVEIILFYTNVRNAMSGFTCNTCCVNKNLHIYVNKCWRLNIVLFLMHISADLLIIYAQLYVPSVDNSNIKRLRRLSSTIGRITLIPNKVHV